MRFSMDKPQIRVMYAWDFAHRQARLGQWEQCARDRERFRARIARAAETIIPVIMRKMYLNK